MTRGKNISWMVILLLAAGLLAGCSGSDDFDEKAATPQGNTNQTSQDAIKINTVLWQVTPAARRATTIDDLLALQRKRNGFRCFCYFDGTTNQFINGSTMSYENSAWSFDDNITRYWPYSEALNFFAFAPKTLDNTYCTFDATPYDVSTNPDGYSDRTARIVCTGLPVAITKGSDTTQELLLAFAANQTRAANAAAGVTLNFKHPFARVCFKLSSASGTAVKVNSITISGDTYRNGTCTLNGAANPQTFTWSGHDNAGSFVISKGTGTGAVATGDDFYLVIPNNYGTKTLTVNATWSEWGNAVMANVSANVDFNWAAGTSYTYTLTLSKYALKVDTSSKFTEQW